MNRAKQLIKFIEDVINPEDKYTTASKENTVTSGPHKKLTSEAQRQLKEAGGGEPLKKAAYDYSRSMYKPMNNYLRHNEPNDALDFTKSHINNMKKLTKSPTKHEFYAYRGVHSSHNPHATEGEILHDKGFTSASLSTRVAKGFAGVGGSLFRIHVTPGTKGHYISGHDRIEGAEREFVLHPGTKFRVGKTVTHPSGHTFTELHVHSQED